MKKTPPIRLPEKDNMLYGFRSNLLLSEHRIFLLLLKEAFKREIGLTSAKKDILTVYATVEMGRVLKRETQLMGRSCMEFANNNDKYLIYWNSNPNEIAKKALDFEGKIFNHLTYKAGHIYCQFNPQLVPLLDVVLKKFDKYGYDVASLAKAKSKFTPRLQEMLLLGRGSGCKNIYTVDQLKAILAADKPDAYAIDAEFITHCIKPAVKELSAISGEELSYEVFKERSFGSAVKKVQFGKQNVDFLAVTPKEDESLYWY